MSARRRTGAPWRTAFTAPRRATATGDSSVPRHGSPTGLQAILCPLGPARAVRGAAQDEIRSDRSKGRPTNATGTGIAKTGTFECGRSRGLIESQSQLWEGILPEIGLPEQLHTMLQLACTLRGDYGMAGREKKLELWPNHGTLLPVRALHRNMVRQMAAEASC